MAFKDLQRIRHSVLQGRMKLTNHALEEMDEEDLEVQDIESVLMTGQIVQKQKHGMAVKYRIYGKTVVREPMTVIGKFTETHSFLIITVFRGD